MAADFQIKQGDQSPVIEIQATDSDGNALNLQSATARFHMVDFNYKTKIDEAAQIFDAVNGKVRYNWAAGDTDRRGYFYAEFEITYGDNSVETVPNDGFILINVERELA